MIALPPAISEYFATPQNSTRENFATCFASDAVVHDEGKSHRGLDAIKAWHIAAIDANAVTTRVLSMRDERGRKLVPAEVSGTFKGSPVTLVFTFVLQNGLITELEIN